MKTSLLSAFALVGLCACGSAATILPVGSVEGGEVTDWRTSSTIKSLDIDGDSFYGTHGAVHWTVAGVNQHPAGSTNPGWAYISDTGQAGPAGYSAIDHVNNYPTDIHAGIVFGATFEFELTGDASTYAGQTVRVGVMHDVLTAAEWAADQFKGLQIVQTVGGSGDSGSVQLRGGAAGNGVPEMYFFNMTGVSAGDRFQILGLSNLGGTSGNGGYLGPVSWDLIPEPSAAMLLSVASLALLRRRSRV